MLHGRGAERARIERLIDAARAGQGGALVVHGEPGSGKSALLADVSSALTDMQVLRTQGIELEAPLPFAALQRLLRPVMSHADRLPAPQSQALRIAFGEQMGQVDRFLVFLGTLSLLAEAAESVPVLALVDDAHWLDDASAAALLFVARRLQVERVAVVFAARDADVRTFEAPDLDRLQLTGLDLGAVTALLRERRGADIATEVSAQLLASTGGNPLALVELPQLLTADQLAGRTPLPGRLPVTGAVERVFLHQARRLTAAAQRLLLVASADDSTQIRTVVTAAVTLGANAEALAEALAEAESSGLIAVEAGHVRLRHPLVRSAIYTGATSGERRQAHSALAAAMTAPDEADRRAWHLAEAATGPDEDVAAALAEAAARALRRSGYEAASAAFARAAELTESQDARGRRLQAAASSAWLAGQPARTGTLATDGRRRATDPVVQAELDRLRGRAEFHIGSIPMAVHVWTQAARNVAAHDPGRAREIAVMASAASTFAAPADRTDLDPTELSTAFDSAAPPRERLVTGLLFGFHHLLAGRLTSATVPLRAAFAAAPEPPEPDLANAIGIASFHLADDAAFGQTFTSLLTHAREHAAYGLLLFALPRLALAAFCAGRLDDAVAHAAEARRLADASAEVSLSAMPLAELALYAAVQGDDRFDAHLADLDRVLARHQVGVLGALVSDARRWALGEHDLIAGRYAAALHHFEQMRTPPLIHLAGYSRLEAATRADRPDVAHTWWAELGGFAAAVESAHAHALVAYGAALLADDDADRHFQAALAQHAHSGRPLEAARTRLAYGEHLRRRRQRVAAREHLRAALNTFDDVGASPWAERARQGLRATGETVRKRDPSTSQDLTPQERQVAKLVAAGLAKPRCGGPAVRQPSHRGLPSAQRLRQDRRLVPHRTRPAATGLTSARHADGEARRSR